MQVNGLATLVLDCEFATKKGSESHGFLEGELWKPEFDSRIGHHVKNDKRGACKKKAVTLLPNRTAAI